MTSTNFTAIFTSTEYITRYTYTSPSAKFFFNADLKSLQDTYGEDAVTVEKVRGGKVITVTQPLYTDASKRPYKTESF